jgi:hypothetical protein
MREDTQAKVEVRSALEVWLASGTRTPERLTRLVRHWCAVYARDDAYTGEAIEEAQRLAERHVQEQ